MKPLRMANKVCNNAGMWSDRLTAEIIQVIYDAKRQAYADAAKIAREHFGTMTALALPRITRERVEAGRIIAAAIEAKLK